MIPNPKHNMFSTNDFTSAKPLVNNQICRYIQLQITVSNIDDSIKPSIVLKKDSHRDWNKGISISKSRRSHRQKVEQPLDFVAINLIFALGLIDN